MKTAYVFPGQGSQFPGMAQELYNENAVCRSMMDEANEILGFPITEVMFHGTPEDLKQTNVTQPAVFLHSVVLARSLGQSFCPAMVAGHSLGEFSALVAAEALTFQDGLRLVSARAQAMQQACQLQPSTMAAVLKLDDASVEQICKEVSVKEIVVPANYNCPGQLVISGTLAGVESAIQQVKALKGRALPLAVGGAFHSPLMEPARRQLAEAIAQTPFKTPVCPVFQNVTAQPETDPYHIQQNLIAQLTAPVRWTEIVQNMMLAGAEQFFEVGPGTVLQGLIHKINPTVSATSV